MDVIQLNPRNMNACSTRIVEVLKHGGVALFPTDTLYGLGADAFSDEAVEKVYAIKGRDEHKPVHALVSDIDMAEKYAEVGDDARLLAKTLPKGKVTLICKKRPGFDTGIGRGLDTFGFRIPDSELCIEMVRAFGKPVTATSANKAGKKPLRAVADILEQLGDGKSGIALVIDGGELPASESSTVIDLSGPPVILREGAVPASDVWEAIRTE